MQQDLVQVNLNGFPRTELDQLKTLAAQHGVLATAAGSVRWAAIMWLRHCQQNAQSTAGESNPSSPAGRQG